MPGFVRSDEGLNLHYLMFLQPEKTYTIKNMQQGQLFKLLTINSVPSLNRSPSIPKSPLKQTFCLVLKEAGIEGFHCYCKVRNSQLRCKASFALRNSCLKGLPNILNLTWHFVYVIIIIILLKDYFILIHLCLIVKQAHISSWNQPVLSINKTTGALGFLLTTE